MRTTTSISRPNRSGPGSHDSSESLQPIGERSCPGWLDSWRRSLEAAGLAGVRLAPYTAAEASPDWSGNCEFADTESGALHQRRVDPGLLRRYTESYRDHFSRWKAASLRNRTPLARIPSAPRFEDAVQLEAIPGGALLFA